MVTPSARRHAVQHVVDLKLLSEQRACRLVGLSRSVFRYQSCRADDSALRQRLLELASQYPRYGYPTLHGLLKAEQLVVNPKRTYRLYTEERTAAAFGSPFSFGLEIKEGQTTFSRLPGDG